MIYISSTNSKKNNIKDAVLAIANYGFKNIELSGGTKFYPKMKNDLIALKKEFNLNYRLHNYFPPPQKSFVLNLASSDKDVINASRKMVKTALDWSHEFESSQYGIHAGFRMTPKTEELGLKINSRPMISLNESLSRFEKEFSLLSDYATKKGVTLYIENNVFSYANLQSFKKENPFLMTNSREILGSFSFPLLLDIAHLKVSCHTLGLNFNDECKVLLKQSDYIHVSDNDGLSDSNNQLNKDSPFLEILKSQNLKEKTFTLEIYDGLDTVMNSYQILNEII